MNTNLDHDKNFMLIYDRKLPNIGELCLIKFPAKGNKFISTH